MTRRKAVANLTALGLTTGVVSALAADVPPPLKIVQDQLPNGMKIVLAEDHSRPVTNLQIWYKVGSKDEKVGRTGFAHLFEHMMFRGSKNVGPEEHMRYVREAGGEVNAYTSFDMTVYWESFPSNYLERMLWLEADRMATLDVSDENFKKEREVVKEERRMRYENPPYGTLMEDVLAAVFQKYPYKHLPIGSMEDLNNSTIDDVRAFHSVFYVPNNATLVMVGDFETKPALELIRKQFARVPKSANPVPRVTVTEPPQTELVVLNKAYKNAPLDGVFSAYRLPPVGHPDSYALEIASNILSSGQSSRLYKRLVYEERTALMAMGEALFLEGPSLFFGGGIANQGKNIQEVSTSLQYVFEQMRTKPVSDAELAKAKNQVLASFITGRESVQAKADFLGKVSVMLGDPNLYNTEIEKYRKVTAEDVQRVCKAYLLPGNETRLFIKPEGN